MHLINHIPNFYSSCQAAFLLYFNNITDRETFANAIWAPIENSIRQGCPIVDENITPGTVFVPLDIRYYIRNFYIRSNLIFQLYLKEEIDIEEYELAMVKMIANAEDGYMEVRVDHHGEKHEFYARDAQQPAFRGRVVVDYKDGEFHE